jgi:hypothetical protein
MVPPVSMMTSLRTLSGICLDRLDGRWPRLLVWLAKVDVLVLDDLALRPLTGTGPTGPSTHPPQ